MKLTLPQEKILRRIAIAPLKPKKWQWITVRKLRDMGLVVLEWPHYKMTNAGLVERNKLAQ